MIPNCQRLPAVLMKDIYGVAKRVAARYCEGRIVLAGDSAHVTNTRGGMNMNCGIHDAFAHRARDRRRHRTAKAPRWSRPPPPSAGG